jgi:hypothetical protein
MTALPKAARSITAGYWSLFVYATTNRHDDTAEMARPRPDAAAVPELIVDGARTLTDVDPIASMIMATTCTQHPTQHGAITA